MHVNVLAFLGGVPRQIVCDNLKAGITRACFYEPLVNRTYADLATYYGTAIIPARPHKARDKATCSTLTMISSRTARSSRLRVPADAAGWFRARAGPPQAPTTGFVLIPDIVAAGCASRIARISSSNRATSPNRSFHLRSSSLTTRRFSGLDRVILPPGTRRLGPEPAGPHRRPPHTPRKHSTVED